MTKSGKHCCKMFWAISSSVTMFSKSCLLQVVSESVYMRERVQTRSIFTEHKILLINETFPFSLFSSHRCCLTPLQQTTFENLLAKEEIVHDEQFLLLPKCFLLYSIIGLLFIEGFWIFDLMFLSHLLQMCCIHVGQV